MEKTQFYQKSVAYFENSNLPKPFKEIGKLAVSMVEPLVWPSRKETENKVAYVAREAFITLAKVGGAVGVGLAIVILSDLLIVPISVLVISTAVFTVAKGLRNSSTAEVVTKELNEVAQNPSEESINLPKSNSVQLDDFNEANLENKEDLVDVEPNSENANP